MKKYKNKALWRTYLFIVLCTVVITGAFLYSEWKDIKHHTGTEQRYANNLVAHSMESLLRKNEHLLKVLGERFLELLKSGETPQVLSTMNQVLRSNTELVGMGIVNEEGKFIVSTFDHSTDQLPNLLEKEETRSSFQKTLQSPTLVMGRTYYVDALESWIIPIRLRIVDADGSVAGVIVTGFRLGAVHGLWSKENLPEHLGLVVVRGDFYRQYVSFIDKADYQQWYGEAVPVRFTEFIDNLFKTQVGFGLKDLRSGNHVISVIVPNKMGVLNYATISYDPVFEHFTIITTKLTLLYERLWDVVSWVFAVFVLFNVGLYIIFRLNIRLHFKNESLMTYQIEHDPLTNLPNRRFLTRSFNSWFEKHPNGFALLYIDLDNFKSSNDLHGHSVGDQILREVANRTESCFQNCICARQGGDEFIILMDTGDVVTLQRQCNEYVELLKRPVVVDQLEFSIEASIGIAMSPNDGQNLDELLRKADMAMYEAKDKHKDLCFYSADIEEKAKRFAEIEKALRSAVVNKEMHVVYQPQIDAKTQEVLGVESLVRWESETLGFVPPDEFITVAEATGSIHEIGLFVLETALQECSDAWKQSNYAKYKLRVSVNVSVRQLLAEGFVKTIQELSEQYNSEPITLMIEVTESLFIEDLSRARDVLNQISTLGVYTSLDDFGTGYSSLSVLSKLPINELKIDRSFVNDILIDEQDWLLAKSIINLSKSLSIPVVAEGVETKEQGDILAANGCDLFQGYFFAKPMRKNDLVLYLEKTKR